MFSKFRIKTKMMLALCSVILLMYGITIFLVTYNTNAIIKEEAFEKTNNLASYYSEIIKTRIQEAMHTAQLLAHTYEGMIKSEKRPDKTALDGALQEIMDQNPEFVALWIMIDPGELIETHYYPWLHRKGGQVKLEPVETLEEYKSESNKPFFAIPKQKQKEALLEPYLDESNVMMTSTVVPIIVNNHVVGVAGVDIALDSLAKLVSELKPYGTGIANLLSNSGIYVAHPDKSMVSKPLEK
ncbi:MAG: chemotaxis protein, partial [Deltaproteobacteria bacterium]